ncbi:unnamed protein product [Ixodes persulcatus]
MSKWSKCNKKQVNCGPVCCVVGCNNTHANTPDLVYYWFPSKTAFPSRRKLWQNAIRKSGRVSKYWQPPRYARICNRHFRGHKKSDDINDANYVPSIFPKMSDTHGFTKKQLVRYKSSQELCKRKMMLLGQLPDVVTNGAEDDSKPAVKFETSSVGVGCSLKLDGQSGNANLLVFSCFSDGRNVATQACVPGRRKFADRGTQAGMGTLPPSNPCLDPRDGGAR